MEFITGRKPRVEWEHRVLTEFFDLERGLIRPAAFGWLVKPYIVDAEARDRIAAEAPVDGREVVDWMHDCAAANAVLFGAMEEYDRLGSELLATSSDPYIPGVALSSDFKFRSDKAEVVDRRGYSVVMTPVGTFNVPEEGCTTIADRDFLGWAAGTGIRGRVIQWKGTLMRWLELASKPVTSRVRCANIDGLVAPQFFNIPAPLALPVNRTTVVVTSDKPQTVLLRGRSPTDYGTVMFDFKQDIPSGQTSILYRVIGLPRATAHVLEIQPEHRTATVIDSIT
jgi:hypothetical protein